MWATGPAVADAKFEAFIQNSIWPQVKAAGISRALFDEAFAGITEPDQTVLKLAKTQPEFTSTTDAYLAKAVTPIRIETGQAMKIENAKLMTAIEQEIWRGPTCAAGHLGHGVKFWQRQGLDECDALVGHFDLCRTQA